MRRRHLLAAAAGTLAAPRLARAQAADRVRVGIFNVTTTLPFHVAQERGIFARHGIEAQAIMLQAPPLIVQAMVSGDADATSNLVTIEGANINARRAGTALFFSLNGQNADHRMEQFLVRPNSTARAVRDLRGGARILTAPGPANINAARFVLRSQGLEEGRDFTLTEQPMGVHVGALQAGSFDAAYTIEPVASIAVRQGAARILEAGVISTHLLGRREAFTWASGPAVTEAFLQRRPEVARRYVAAWKDAVELIKRDPASVRPLFASHMNTPADLADAIPMLDFRMAADLTPTDVQDFQRFIDIAVQQGVVRERVDVRSMIRSV
ncbi:MAG: ABC transporter substrate-binding protein [Acetobacteraceae bacterium]|nr:ABC transporter substrate-binding protein [Acetobacteraceae bacterium]